MEDVYKRQVWIDVRTPETYLSPGYKNEGELKAIDLVLKALQQADGYSEFVNAQQKPEEMCIRDRIHPMSMKHHTVAHSSFLPTVVLHPSYSNWTTTEVSVLYSIRNVIR